MNPIANRLSELDALRGIAALMVVGFHFTMGRPEAAYGFKYGICGVDLFFIISGFVIFMSLARVKSGKDFIIGRLSRLYPAYWAAVTFTFLLIIGRAWMVQGNLAGVSLLNYFVNLTMFQFFFLVPDLDGPYWSLTVELMFYLSLLFLLQKKLLKWITPLAITLIAFAVTLQLLFWNLELKIFFYAFALLKYLPLFLAGITFYRIYHEKKNRLWNHSLLAFCFLSQVLLFRHCARARVFMSQAEFTAALAMVFGVFLLFVQGRLQFIVCRGTLFLGRISYPLYLVHQFLSLQVLFPFLINSLHLPFWIAAFGITLPIDLLLAYAITRLVDEPFSKQLKSALTGPHKTALANNPGFPAFLAFQKTSSRHDSSLVLNQPAACPKPV